RHRCEHYRSESFGAHDRDQGSVPHRNAACESEPRRGNPEKKDDRRNRRAHIDERQIRESDGNADVDKEKRLEEKYDLAEKIALLIVKRDALARQVTAHP